MKRLLFALSFFLLAFTNVYSQSPSEPHQKIKAALEKREYPVVIAELENAARTDRKLFELNNYDYLLARMAEKTGDFAKASANYQTVVKRGSVLKEYALWHISQIARASGNLMLERMNLQEIIAFAPDSLIFMASKNRLARSWFESANYDEAIRLLSEPQSSTGIKTSQQKAADDRLLRDNRALLARAYLHTGNTAKARELFIELINKQTNPAQPDDFSLAAAKGLDLLDGGQENLGKTAPKISDNDHLQRAMIYHFNRDFSDARLHYLAIIQDYPASNNVANAIYQTGRCLVQQGEYAEALPWFERVEKQFPSDPLNPDALREAASAYARINKPKEAIARYQKFIEKYPDNEKLDRAYLNTVDVLRDHGDDAEALKWTAKTQEVFKGKMPEALALFSQARIRIAKSDWTNALTDIERLLTFADLGGVRFPGGTNTAEITFLKGFVLEQMQRFPEAIDIYLSIPDGRGEYYGWRATERLRALANNEKTKPVIEQKFGTFNGGAKDSEGRRKTAHAAIRLTDSPEIRSYVLKNLKEIYATLPAYQKVPAFKLMEFGRKDPLQKERAATTENTHQRIADELLFLGLYDEGAPELEIAAPAPSTDLGYTLAVYYLRGDMAHRAVGLAEPLWRTIPADYQVELIPRDQVELLYPAPYADSLLKYGTPRGVDPRFLLSIMRQESRYRADVKSYAAARGLMQFITSTSGKIADGLGRKNFRQDELYDPAVAILFGSQYVADIFKLFPDQPQAVAASYNGGEDNVKRWLIRSQSDRADRYVPEIVFSQSKDYAYKVMANYRVYRSFYDENLRPR